MATSLNGDLPVAQLNPMTTQTTTSCQPELMPQPVINRTEQGHHEPHYSAADSEAIRQEGFRLIYESYLRVGLCHENPWKMRVTPYHLLDTTTMYVSSVNRQVVSTLSLIEDSANGLPMESVYPNAIRERRVQGIRIAEISCLADRREKVLRFLDGFVQLTRLVAQYARHQGVDQLLIVCHPKHAEFYRRFMAFEKIGGLTECPHVCNRPAVALCLDFKKIDRVRPRSWDLFFADSISATELQRPEMLLEERHRLADMIDPRFRETSLPDVDGVFATV